MKNKVLFLILSLYSIITTAQTMVDADIEPLSVYATVTMLVVAFAAYKIGSKYGDKK